MRAERALGVELGAARGALLDHLDRLDPGASEGEELLHPDAVAVARDGEVAGRVAAAVVDR